MKSLVKTLTKFTLTVAIASTSISMLQPSRSEAAMSAILAAPALVAAASMTGAAGLGVAAFGGLSSVPAAIVAGLVTHDGIVVQSVGVGLLVGGVALGMGLGAIALVMLDEESGDLKYSALPIDRAQELGLTASEGAAYNRELEAINVIADEMTAFSKLPNITGKQITARADELKAQLLSPEAASATGKISLALLQSIH
jgi:hypothetical protein